VIDWCCMYKNCGKTVDHLLLHCEVVRALWNYVFGLCGLEWVMPQWVMDLYSSWRQ
jgi:hypothetical protein